MEKILVLDDEPQIRSVLVKLLSKQGFECISACNAEEAEDVLAREIIGLALVDIDLPGKSGLDFLRHAREASPDTAIIMLTGIVDQRVVSVALEAGIYAYILKPFERDQLLLLVRNALKQRQIEIENRRYRERLEEILAARIESLKQSQAKLSAIASSAYNPIILADDQGRICFWNRAAEKVFGYPEHEALGMPFQSLIAEDGSTEICYKDLEPCKTNEEGTVMGKNIEVTALRKNGEGFPVELSLSLLELEGRPHTLAIAKDITERKKIQRQREFEHQRFVSIFDSITELIYVSDPVTYEILYVNKTLEKALGKNPVGELCYKVFQNLDKPCDFCTNSKILENKKRPYYWEFYNARLDKYFKIVDRIIEWPDGRDVRFEFAMDISDLKRAEKDLKRAHEKATLLLGAITSILIALDEEDRVVEWNNKAEEILNVSSREALGKRLCDIDIAWSSDAIMKAIETCRYERQEVRLDDIPLKANGDQNRLLGITIACVIGDDGSFKGTMIRAADITERRLLERQLAQAQKLEAIGQLAAGSAHEINTPTQFIGDNLHFLTDAFKDLSRLGMQYEELIAKVPEDHMLQAFVKTIRSTEEEIDLSFLKEEIPKALEQSLDGVERVTKIVRAMKEFSHPGSPEKTPVDINHAIENAITVAKNEWKYVADIETDLDPDLPPVPCLPADLNQVILNLIINAAHAIEKVVGNDGNRKGKIRVITRKDNGWAEIAISDTGCGIPDSIRHRIFDPFFTTKEVGKGTGQGLSIAHSIIVDKHGGTIDFESREGKGTTFTIKLPLGQGSSGEGSGLSRE